MLLSDQSSCNGLGQKKDVYISLRVANTEVRRVKRRLRVETLLHSPIFSADQEGGISQIQLVHFDGIQ